MDLVSGAKQVLIVMDHVSKRGDLKILDECSLPLTGKGVVDRLVTSLAVIEVTPDGLRLIERAPACPSTRSAPRPSPSCWRTATCRKCRCSEAPARPAVAAARFHAHRIRPVPYDLRSTTDSEEAGRA